MGIFKLEVELTQEQGKPLDYGIHTVLYKGRETGFKLKVASGGVFEFIAKDGEAGILDTVSFDTFLFECKRFELQVAAILWYANDIECMLLDAMVSIALKKRCTKISKTILEGCPSEAMAADFSSKLISIFMADVDKFKELVQRIDWDGSMIKAHTEVSKAVREIEDL